MIPNILTHQRDTPDSDSLFYVIQQGADWNEQLEFCNDDWSVINLTGCSADLQIFQSPQNPIVLLELSTAAGTMTLNGVAGRLNWARPAAQTALFQPSPGLLSPLFGFDPMLRPFGFCNLRVKWSNGQIFRNLSGQVALSLGSTSNL
ncbi:hypothetical protein [Paraburkholderia sediminicola]|uniref:hypothetical protein n=1 Tax=Paraburkholderia sediminicola TaxID=458836 RepID=UPI0038B7BDE1